MASMHLPEEDPNTERARKLGLRAHKERSREGRKTETRGVMSQSEPESLSVSCKSDRAQTLERCLLPGLTVQLL